MSVILVVYRSNGDASDLESVSQVLNCHFFKLHLPLALSSNVPVTQRKYLPLLQLLKKICVQAHQGTAVVYVPFSPFQCRALAKRLAIAEKSRESLSEEVKLADQNITRLQVKRGLITSELPV